MPVYSSKTVMHWDFRVSLPFAVVAQKTFQLGLGSVCCSERDTPGMVKTNLTNSMNDLTKNKM